MARDDEYVICPHCGEEHGDAWEWCKSENPSTVHCQSCDQPFSAWAEYSVDYVTNRMEMRGRTEEQCVEAWNAHADHALALAAEAYEVVAKDLETISVPTGDTANASVGYPSVGRRLADRIRALTPSDALAAREARDAEMRDRGRKEALREAASHFIEQDIADEILAFIEGDQT